MKHHCIECGKFVSNVTAHENGLGDIVMVTGECKTHGVVDITGSDWWYEDFQEKVEETMR